ncbi:tryptophan synthase subunit alpha [Paraburkholderia sp. UYCP14C]|uniref:tryptophan synthase subunit alpha n=1 Tax=Paraburkholderia sp. UYCP14C TaxID=2511130 RepID=UPI0027D2FED5|nr:tryptophan synthase subunit alpha [Paraburkholderia sp. UYCP14C]
MSDAVRVGADALLLVDLPVEHAAPYRESARAAGLHLIAMTASTSDDARLAEVLCEASGFVYHTALTGTTGAMRCVPAEVSKAITRVRRHTTLPVAAGFGIRDTAQAQALAGTADLIVVGSQLIELLASKGVEEVRQAVRRYAECLANGSGSGA